MANTRRNEYEPDVVSPPGATLQDVLDERGMTQADLASRMDRPKKTISEIVSGKEALTPRSALQLERVLGIPADFWMRREALYREHLARDEEANQLASATDWVSQFPVKEMARFGWIARHPDPVDQARELLGFFGIAAPTQWAAISAAFRQSTCFDADRAAVSAWLRRGELEAQAISCAPFDPRRFREALADIRDLTVTGPQVFVPELRTRCAAAGVAVVFVRELPKTRASGATRWLSPRKAVIQLSLRHRSDDHLWFTFYHEAGHILLHGKRAVFIELGHERNEQEKEADRFAADMLIPPSAFRSLRSHPPLTAKVISQFAQEVRIAPGIVVGRLQHERLLPFNRHNELKVRFEWARAK